MADLSPPLDSPEDAPEADHGPVLPTPPEALTGLHRGEVRETAAGAASIRIATKHVVGSLGVKDGLRMLARLNQVDGLDCQSCAWPDPRPGERATLGEFCENGAKVTAEENTSTCLPDGFFQQHSVAELSERSDYWLAKQGRIPHPVVLHEGATHYEPISWDDAFALLADELNGLGSPDEAAFYTSGRTSNEAAFLYQLVARQFGTNNLPDCSNMCHESSGTALSETIGIGKGTVTLEGIETTDLLIDIGHNPGSCHPRMLSALQTLKRNGGEVIAINPLPETGLNHFKHPQDFKHPTRLPAFLAGDGTPIADFFVHVRIAGDLALLTGIAKELLDAEDRAPGTVLDHAFIRDHTEGFDAFAEAVRAEPWETILDESAVTREEIRRIADRIVANERLIIAWAMGLTQQPQAVAAIQMAVNLVLMRGSIGRPDAGLCPVRGHSNVQGDRTMGIWERMPDTFLDRLGAEFGFEPPRAHGLATVDTIRAMHEGAVKVFVGMGGNFLSAGPDTEYAAEAMRRCRLTAQVSTKLNRGHLVTGRIGLILPTLGRAEADVQASGPQFVSVENSMGIVSSSRGRLRPASAELRSEPAIIAGMAEATLGDRSTVDWSGLAADYDRIRDHIERVIPGFEDYNERVRQPGGFYLPNPARDAREFRTEAGKALFTAHRIEPVPLEPDQLLMMTVRSHDQFNTTVYGLDDRYRGIYNERRVVMMNAGDIRERGLEPGQPVDLTSHWDGETRTVRRFLVVEHPIPRRCVATYFPEANPLVPIGSVAKRSGTPTSKCVIVTVAPTTTEGLWDYERSASAQPASG